MKVIDTIEKFEKEVLEGEEEPLVDCLIKDMDIPEIDSKILLSMPLSDVIFVNCSFNITSKKVSIRISDKVSFINCDFGKHFEVIFKGAPYLEKRDTTLSIKGMDSKNGNITLSGNIYDINIIDSNLDCITVSKYEKGASLRLINSNIKRLLFGDSIGYYRHYPVIADSLHFISTEVDDFILFEQVMLYLLSKDTSLYKFMVSDSVNNVEIYCEIKDSDLRNMSFLGISFYGTVFTRCKLDNADFSKSNMYKRNQSRSISFFYCGDMNDVKVPAHLGILEQSFRHKMIVSVSDPRLESRQE